MYEIRTYNTQHSPARPANYSDNTTTDEVAGVSPHLSCGVVGQPEQSAAAPAGATRNTVCVGRGVLDPLREDEETVVLSRDEYLRQHLASLTYGAITTIVILTVVVVLTYLMTRNAGAAEPEESTATETPSIEEIASWTGDQILDYLEHLPPGDAISWVSSDEPSAPLDFSCSQFGTEYLEPPSMEGACWIVEEGPLAERAGIAARVQALRKCSASEADAVALELCLAADGDPALSSDDLDPWLLYAIAVYESTCNPFAKGRWYWERGQRYRAIGLLQVSTVHGYQNTTSDFGAQMIRDAVVAGRPIYHSSRRCALSPWVVLHKAWALYQRILKEQGRGE